MLIPPFWRGRGKHVPAGIRLARFRTVLKAAQAIPVYRNRLSAAKLDTPQLVEAVLDVDSALASIEPLPYETYQSVFRERKPSWRQSPHRLETRSAVLIHYPLARAGLDTCHTQAGLASDLYSAAAVAGATTDLVHLARALEDKAVAAFSGMDAGVLTGAQRDDLWRKYQVPLFEQFLGTDGRVAAAECEVHAGLHIRAEAAVIECLDGEIVLTSLTDEAAPALRVRSGLAGLIDGEVCECGRPEPRLVRLRRMPASNSSAAVA